MAGGYKAKSGIKAERKLGLKAVAALNNDPNWPRDKILATAQQYEKTFSDVDEYNDVLFCDTMEKLRSQKPDLYAVFWWWRLAHEHAAKTAEDEGEAKPETRYRTFMVTQFLARPFSDLWEDDRKTLKLGATPLITDEIILDGLDHRTIKRWAYVWHDRDIYTEEDEITDRDQLRKAGERKFKHVHVMLDIPAKVPVSTVARWFNVPPQQVDIMRGRGAFIEGVEYIVHESPKAVAQGKTHYDDDEVYASEGFDFRRELNDLQANRLKYGKRAGEMSPADSLQANVLTNGWTLRQCREYDPLSYIKVRNKLFGLRLDYMQDHEKPCPFRMNIYIDGQGSIGKSAFSEYLAEAMFPNDDYPHFSIGGDDRVTFDGYDGEPCIIWDDMRVADFIRQFGSNGTFRILDPHPKKIAQQAKHSRVILMNQLNIINGIEPYDEFIEGLAHAYRDKHGVQHGAEDENQAWRRFPMIICLREEDFDVLINQGFVNHDLRSIKTMQVYAHVTGSMKDIQETLEGNAREKILLNYGRPVLEAKKVIDDSHNEKISDPDQIPARFADYGKVISEEEYQEALRQKLVNRSIDDATRRSTDLMQIAYNLWEGRSLSESDDTYYRYCNERYGSAMPIASEASVGYIKYMIMGRSIDDLTYIYQSSLAQCLREKRERSKYSNSLRYVSVTELYDAFIYYWLWARAHVETPDCTSEGYDNEDAEPLSEDEARELLAKMGLTLSDSIATPPPSPPADLKKGFHPNFVEWEKVK